MAGVYHHVEEYDDKMPAPTDDLEVYRNTKFSQQWDKKIEQTVTVLDHCPIITDKLLSVEERKPSSLQFPVVAKEAAKTPVEGPPPQQEGDKNVVASEQEPSAVLPPPPATVTKEMEEWRHASQIIKKRMDGATLKLNERRRFLVGSAMAGEYIRLCELVKASGGGNLYRLRGGDRPLAVEHLTYGEANMDGFVKVLQRIGLREGQRFLDLGSGAGTLVILASLFGCESVGVEVVEGLHETAMVLLDRWEEGKPRGDLDTAADDLGFLGNVSRCHFLLQDMFAVPWSNYDVVYACSTCFGAPMCKRIAAKAAREMDRGVILSVSKPLHGLKVVDTVKCLFSWGKDTVFVHAPTFAEAATKK